MAKEQHPLDPAAFGLPDHPACPFCEREETHLVSPFGPQLSVATYWCRHCHTAFEVMKWKADQPSADR
jgi:hypothetical protein